ncbi:MULTISPECIES: hypothetical protein [unclassified Sphingomonas]|jgi:hypothetical protein|uniref:hypothetical protein n=1 Tax=unclassified Sphingomonas TaxID=196159 RepID=UPI00082F3A69|nr:MULTISPECIES: hypothetical protein [unclassified Sphingomonas]
MDTVVRPSTTWLLFADAWRARDQRIDDIAHPSAERDATALLRQYVAAAGLLGGAVAVAIVGIAISPPSAVAAIGGIIVALAFGYALVLTELTAVPETLRAIPTLPSRRLRRLRLATAAIGTVETILPLILAVAIVVVHW